MNAGIVRLSGDVNAETYKGSIVLNLPGTAGFELSAESGRGSLNVEFPAETGRGSRRRGLVARGAVNGGGRGEPQDGQGQPRAPQGLSLLPAAS